MASVHDFTVSDIWGEPVPLEFSGGPLTLYLSRLHPKGARYEPLARVSLH